MPTSPGTPASPPQLPAQPSAAPQAPADQQAPAQPRGRLAPTAAVPVMLVLAGAVSVQCGAGIASRLFTQVPPAAVTALRLWAATLILVVIAGPGTARTIRGLAPAAPGATR